MTRASDIASSAAICLQFTELAKEIHKRDQHELGGDDFDSCPYFPCSTARDAVKDVVREAKKIYGKPFLVKKETA